VCGGCWGYFFGGAAEEEGEGGGGGGADVAGLCVRLLLGVRLSLSLSVEERETRLARTKRRQSVRILLLQRFPFACADAAVVVVDGGRVGRFRKRVCREWRIIIVQVRPWIVLRSESVWIESRFRLAAFHTLQHVPDDAHHAADPSWILLHLDVRHPPIRAALTRTQSAVSKDHRLNPWTRLAIVFRSRFVRLLRRRRCRRDRQTRPWILVEESRRWRTGYRRGLDLALWRPMPRRILLLGRSAVGRWGVRRRWCRSRKRFTKSTSCRRLCAEHSSHFIRRRRQGR